MYMDIYTVDGWNPAPVDEYVVYPITYKVYTFQVVYGISEPSTVSFQSHPPVSVWASGQGEKPCQTGGEMISLCHMCFKVPQLDTWVKDNTLKAIHFIQDANKYSWYKHCYR